MKYVGLGHRCRARSSTALIVSLLHAAIGCSGYSDGSSRPAYMAPSVAPEPSAAALPKPEQPPAQPEWPNAPSAPPLPSMPAPPPAALPEPDAGHVSPDDPNRNANLRLTRAPHIDGYLTDARGQALYMFAGDITGALESACLCDCAREWPAFDIETVHTSEELDPAQVSRFHRQDGAWQTTYKGHALYYRASEAGTRDVTGDGVDRLWFVARDYLAFLASARTFAPAGGTATNDTFLTDGFGRTLYVCLDDQPRTATSEAISSCNAACTLARPVFAAPDMIGAKLLPSVINSDELRELVRPDGQAQLSYRGWPLYYYRGDVAVGSTEGHNDRAWRAIDPVAFGLEPETDSDD